MRRRFPALCLVLALAAFSAAACDDENDPPTTPNTPPPTVTESFTGSLNPGGGGVTFAFTVAANGQVTATLVELSSSAVPVSLSLGNWNRSVCQVVLANDNAVQGTFVTGSMSAAGSLCVRLGSGNLESPVTFRVDVVHP